MILLSNNSPEFLDLIEKIRKKFSYFESWRDQELVQASYPGFKYILRLKISKREEK